MDERIRLSIDGRSVTVARGMTVAAAILSSGTSTLRVSITGEPRGPLCGMGICFECRVTIDGVRHERSCNVLCVDGMEVETNRA